MTRLLVLIVILVILTLASVAIASPFLVCKYQAGVTGYRVSLDNGTTWQDVVPDAAGEYGFKLDLASLGSGSYKVKAQACNQWGCSLDSGPFVFSASKASSPQDLKLTGE